LLRFACNWKKEYQWDAVVFAFGRIANPSYEGGRSDLPAEPPEKSAMKPPLAALPPVRLVLTLGILAIWCGQPARAQLLGNRNRTNGESLQERVGSIAGEGARFLRDSRDATDFVGRAPDSAATGEEIRSAVDESLRIDLGPDVNLQNVPALPPRVQLNSPRLQIAFEHRSRSSSELNARLASRLQAKLPATATSPIEVSMGGGEALLRGVVASERDRKMAELLVRFEPGVRGVRNELQVRSPNPARR
jgi:hypothetical protein